jgi:hypothetical protein
MIMGLLSQAGSHLRAVASGNATPFSRSRSSSSSADDGAPEGTEPDETSILFVFPVSLSHLLSPFVPNGDLMAVMSKRAPSSSLSYPNFGMLTFHVTILHELSQTQPHLSPCVCPAAAAAAESEWISPESRSPLLC